MQIACTRKLLDELHAKPSEPQDMDAAYSWRANLIRVNRRKTVVLMCDKTRYVVVLYGLKAKDFTRLDMLITRAIHYTLLADHINPEIIDRYLEIGGTVHYTKNSDRAEAAKLTHACRDTEIEARHLEDTTQYNDSLGVFVSHRIVGSMDDFFIPAEKMADFLRAYAISPLYKYAALELTVTLELDREKCVRTLLVPQDITFKQLHKIFQIAFEWQNYHLYDFMVFDHDAQWHEDAVAVLVESEEDLDFRSNARLMDGVYISEYLPQYTHMLYNYDYGDNWTHRIQVTKVLEDCAEAYPVCISGIGNAPPEDVGGSGGFENFLDILADPMHEEHEFTRAWGESQRYRDFDIASINGFLRHVIF